MMTDTHSHAQVIIPYLIIVRVEAQRKNSERQDQDIAAGGLNTMPLNEIPVVVSPTISPSNTAVQISHAVITPMSAVPQNCPGIFSPRAAVAAAYWSTYGYKLLRSEAH